jgi:4-amino-4-deoxy-L-arabinose transferase-like glycosyltransferase
MSRWRDRARTAFSTEVLAMFLVALVLRGAHAWLVHGPGAQPSSDSLTYDTLAWNLARGMGFHMMGDVGTYPTAFVPPGVPWLVSLLYRAIGHSFFAAVLLMCVIGALVPPLVRQLGRAMFGPNPGRIAGWLAACDPLLVFFSGYLLTETPFSVALLLALLASESWLKRPTVGRAFGTGIVWGLAALTRPTALPLPLLVAAWSWGPLGLWLAPAERRRHVLMLLLGVVLAIAPWTLRNAVTMRAFVPITTGGGRSLLDANNALVWDDPALRGGAIGILDAEPWATRYRGLTEVEIDRRARSEAVAFLGSRVRDWPGAALAKLSRFWRLSGTTRSTGSWAAPEAGFARRLAALDPLFFWSLLCFPLGAWGVAATWRSTRRHFQLLPLWVIAAFSAFSVLYWGALRLRLPIEPLVMLYAGVGLADVLRRYRMWRARVALVASGRRNA